MRNFRNVIVLLFLIFLIGEVCFYISGALYVLLVFGPNALDFKAIRPNTSNMPGSLYPTIWLYIKHWLRNKSNYSDVLQVKLFGSLLSPFLLFWIVFWSLKDKILEWRPFKKKESIHGDAKWAAEKEIRGAGLRSKEGVIIGKDSKGLLVAPGFQHILLFAPTGSGKGVSFVIPNLLFWRDSVIVHDIKLENYDLTSGWRKSIGQEVYCWNPADPDGLSHCYNPLDWVSSKPGQMVDDVQKIANLLLPEQDFWVNEARSLFLGVVLYLLACDDKVKSFGEVVRTLRKSDATYYLAVVMDTMGNKIHPVAYMNLAAFLQKAEKERSGVISTLNSALELWANPLIDTTTASSDFNFMEFKKKRTTVYVGLTPDNLIRLKPLMQVFYQQATDFFSKKIPDKSEPYGVLMLMDEFPTVGKMPCIQASIAYMRGYRVRYGLIVQDTEQLKGIYEDSGMNSFLSNATYRITFAANNIETANLISQLVGNKTVEQESLNRPKYLDFNPSSRSVHVSEAQRALLLPQEVITLPKDDQIVLIESTSPIRSKKIRYYKDPMFKKRLLKSTFVPTQKPFTPDAASQDNTASKQSDEQKTPKRQIGNEKDDNAEGNQQDWEDES